MIRQRATLNNRPILALLDYLGHYPAIADQEFNAAFNEVRPLMLDSLTYAPEKPKYPIEWQSEKQRKAYFASDGFGSGIPYQRTGALQGSWTMTKEGGGVEIVVIVTNPAPYSKYVVGSLAKSNPGGFMQKMFVKSGYIPAYKIVHYWLDFLWALYRQNMANRLGLIVGNPAVQTRAFTGGTFA